MNIVFAAIGCMALVIIVIHIIFKDDLPNLSNKEISENLFNKPSKLKFESSWFSDDYVTPYFYNHGWHALKRIGKPIIGLEDHWVENISYSLGNGNFEYEKKRWATVGDCLQHNRDIYEQCRKDNESLARQRKEVAERKSAALKKANS